ncbi:MAG: hypothetical protein AAFW73_12925 [Bacteroidota bacterium]
MKSYWIGILLLSLPPYLESDVDKALGFLHQQSPLIERVVPAADFPTAEILSVVAPELIRYGWLRDFMETQALEIAYLNFGSSGADFSIGPFQMKPSFVEKMEAYADAHPDVQDRIPFPIISTASTEKAKRHQRLARLRDPEWQLRYALAFYHIGTHRFGFLQSLSPPERLAFLATAYNYGFDRPVAEIKDWQATEAFPYGRKFRGAQASYASVALAIYRGLEH